VGRLSPREAIDEGTRLREPPADIAGWMRIEIADAPDLAPSAFDVHALIDDVARRWAALAGERGLDLHVKTAPTVPRRAIGEALWLREVFSGLVENALRFTYHGEVVASVTADQTCGGRALLHAEISDTGVGMSAEMLARLFDKPSRDASDSDRRDGGLRVAHRLIELMDGRIGCSSAVGMGTTTWFTVPLDLPLAL
jgi:two-component system, sensor histidine kinase and response regulator